MIRIDSEIIQTSPSGLVDGSYDLVVVGASWDARCLTLVESGGLTSRGALLLRYRNQGTSGASAESYRLLQSYLSATVAQLVNTLTVDSTSLNDTWTTVRKAVVQEYEKAGRPLRLAIDLCSIPRYVSMGLLGLCVKSGCASRITFWYSAASDYRVLDGNPLPTGASQFTMGNWLPQPVPTLSRPTAGATPMQLLVSTGLEGSLTRSLVDDLEPSRLLLVYSGREGGRRLLERAHNENSVLEDAYLLDESDSIEWPLFDVGGLSSWISDRIATSVPDDARGVESSLLICGSKPHALAFAIAACVSDVKNVFFGLSELRREVTGDPVGPFYRCDLRMPLVA